MSIQSYFTRSLTIEILKAKGTLVLWLALVAPLFVVGVAFTASYLEGYKFYHKGVNPWIEFTGHILVGWSLFIFPIYVSLQSALVSAIEHQADTWKSVYSLPLPKWSVFYAKLALFTGLLAISHLVLFGFAEGAGWLLSELKPHYNFQLFTIRPVLAQACFNILLSGLGMASLQFYIGLRFRSFIIPAGFGLFITLAGVISRSQPISRASPYLSPINFFHNATQADGWHYGYVYISLLTYILGAIAGFLSTSQRDVV
ncbi:ABC transporter permease [Spirosoma endbachense]|uniref:ABC transporter permease subunit n=1 Tax=Spirosoma endbachense TaxID=2666025 RepID=A0A6P1VVH7_9BACT|nr:ABC transporter permease [Spirosoma endbachense]QHV95376.1 hypothetical protein GJR95_10300 [Spirosoma endbachense]